MRRDLTGGAKNALAAALLMVLALTLWPAVYSSWSADHDLGLSWRAFLFSCLFVIGVMLWGLLPAGLSASVREIWDLPLVVVTGSSLLGVGLTVLAFLLPLAPWQALLLLVLGGAAIAAASARKTPGLFEPLRRVTPVALLAVGVGLVSASAWSRAHLAAFTDAGREMVYGPWIDGFPLAHVIAMFSDRLQPQALGLPDLHGLPVSFYHYGAYAVAGAFSGTTGAPSLSAFDAFIVPWSFFLLTQSAFALGKHWWGSRIGLVSLAAAAILPDASFYGIKQAWFGYYWMLQISPSLSWGAAIGTCAIVMVDAARRDGARALLLLGLVFASATLLFKAQLAVVVVPSLAVWSVIFFPGIARAYRVSIVALAGITIFVLAQSASQLSLAPDLTLGRDWGADYLNHISAGVQGEHARQLWGQVVASGWLVPRVAMLLAASFGILPLAWLVLVVIRKTRNRTGAGGYLPLFFLLAHLAVVLGLEKNATNGELLHRPFVFVYSILAVWSGGALATLLSGSGRSRWWTAGIVPLLLIPWLLADQARGGRIWFSRQALSTRISKDYLECIDRIREHAARRDVVQVSDHDPSDIVGGLTERTAYLSRPGHWLATGKFSSVVRRRKEELNDLAMAETVERFEYLASELPIRWYVLKPDGDVRWPADVVSQPAFRCGAYRVYDLEPWRP